MSSPKPSQQAFIRNFHCLPNIQMFTYLSMFPFKTNKQKKQKTQKTPNEFRISPPGKKKIADV